MKELELLKELTGNTYKILRYLTLISDDQSVVWGVSYEKIMEDCGIGYNTVYASLRDLKKLGYIEYNGSKQFAKVLV